MTGMLKSSPITNPVAPVAPTTLQKQQKPEDKLEQTWAQKFMQMYREAMETVFAIQTGVIPAYSAALNARIEKEKEDYEVMLELFRFLRRTSIIM